MPRRDIPERLADLRQRPKVPVRLQQLLEAGALIGRCLPLTISLSTITPPATRRGGAQQAIACCRYSSIAKQFGSPVSVSLRAMRAS